MNLTTLLPIDTTAEKIISTVAETWKTRSEKITGEDRTFRLAFARHVAMYLTREMTHHTLHEIGDIFKKDHGTVCYAVRKITKARRNRKVDALIEQIVKKIENSID